MKTDKPKKSLFKRIKSFLLSTLLIIVLVESIALYRLYTLHVDRAELSVNEFGEMEATGSDLSSKVKRLRTSFTDTSADAWAAAQQSSNPEDAWFNIGYRPRADFREEKKSYHIAIDVPGVNPAELSVSVSGLTLSVTGIRHKSEKSGELLLRERFRGEFVRSFDLPGKISAEGIKATVAEGILRISIPKGESDDLNIPVKIFSVEN